jgi:predicted small lipoprotein YifL
MRGQNPGIEGSAQSLWPLWLEPLAVLTVMKVGPAQMCRLRQVGMAAALLALAALGVAGCGVKGPLDVPHDAVNETGNATPGTPAQPAQAPHKPSILDPLIR